MSEVDEKKRTALQAEVRPIVLEYKDRKKKKKRSVQDEDEPQYSKGLKDIQQLEGSALRITKRSVKALSKGLDTYEHERNISAKEKKDGAFEDLIDKSAKAASTYTKEMSEIPIDIAESLNSKSYRKRVHKTLRRVSKAIRLFRI